MIISVFSITFKQTNQLLNQIKYFFTFDKQPNMIILLMNKLKIMNVIKYIH